MGSAIANALLKRKIGSVIVSNPTKPSVKTKWTKDNTTVVKPGNIIIIAVKPAVVRQILAEIQPFLQKNQILISIAAGVPLKKLSMWSGNHKKIVRVMPNLAAQIFESVSVWKASKGLTKKEKYFVDHLFTAFGKSIEVHDEKLIDWATALSGGAPAYTAAFLESFEAVAQKNGFSKKNSYTLTLQAILGSLRYIQKTGKAFSELKMAVQTKGGTTEAAFKVLQRNNWQEIFENSLFTAYKKALALSKNS